MDSIADMLFQISLHKGRYSDPQSLAPFQSQVYSQNGEDGIIAEIFERIGYRNKIFVEIGVQDGTQNNTRFLLERGWRGVWIESSSDSSSKARDIFSGYLHSGTLTLIESAATVENINVLLDRANIPGHVDFLSIDIDQHTSHVWRGLNCEARVSCIEYNAAIPPSLHCEVPYDPGVQWTGTNYYGASLKTLERIGHGKGLSLVGCDLLGVNAFFVSAVEAAGRFRGPFTAEEHYEPIRLPLVKNWGHVPPPDAKRWIECIK